MAEASLKYELQCELKLAGVLSARNPAEVGGERRPVRNVEIGVVEEVIRFGAKLQPHGFAHCELFLQRKVELRQGGSDHRIARCAAESIKRGQSEGPGVEPLLRRGGPAIRIA